MANEFLNDTFFLYAVFLTILGLCLGSFCVSIAKRIYENKRLFSKHSFCFACGKTLRIYELIPLFSYLFLKAKCTQCGSKIPLLEFFGELIGGVLVWVVFLSLWSHFIEFSLFNFIFFTLFLFTLFLLSLIDYYCKAVPQILLWAAFFLAFTLAFNMDEFVYLFLFEQLGNGFLSNAFFFAGFVFLLKSILAFVKSIRTKEIQENLGDADIIILSAFAGLLGIKAAFILFCIAAFFSLPFFLLQNEKELAFLPFVFLAFIVYLVFRIFYETCF